MRNRTITQLLLAMLTASMACAAGAVPDSYRIAPGDVISITVFQEPDASLASVTVPEGGLMPYPLIGDVLAAGRTTQELEAEIDTRLRDGYILRPVVTVRMHQYRPIYVRGAVDDPSAVPYHEGLTVEMVLVLAGVDNASNIDKVEINRAGEDSGFEVASGSRVLPGDIITVPGGETGELIYFHGEVGRQGSVAFRDGLTVEQAIALAGGFTLRASKRKIKITRQSGTDAPPTIIKRAGLQEPVMPGDVITVGASLF